MWMCSLIFTGLALGLLRFRYIRFQLVSVDFWQKRLRYRFFTVSVFPLKNVYRTTHHVRWRLLCVEQCCPSVVCTSVFHLHTPDGQHCCPTLLVLINMLSSLLLRLSKLRLATTVNLACCPDLKSHSSGAKKPWFRFQKPQQPNLVHCLLPTVTRGIPDR